MAQPVSAVFDPNPPAPHLTCDVFQRVQVVNQPTGGTIIGWELKAGTSLPCEPQFFVDFGRPGTDEWEPISESPVINDCQAIDPQQRYYDHLADHYYRVRMLLPCVEDPDTGQCLVILSQPQQANGVWSKRDWLLAREIARKEYLLQRKRTNMTATGNILKRRRWGVLCRECMEFDTGESINTDCERCWGTRFLGGYYPAVDYVFTMNAPWRRGFKRDPKVSMRNDIVRQGRGVNYPHLDSHDIFVRNDSGERFLIHEIQAITEVGNIPVIVQVELRLMPATELAYRVPMAGGEVSSLQALTEPCVSAPSSAQSSESPEPSEPCDYRVGLDDEENW